MKRKNTRRRRNTVESVLAQFSPYQRELQVNFALETIEAGMHLLKHALFHKEAEMAAVTPVKRKPGRPKSQPTANA